MSAVKVVIFDWDGTVMDSVGKIVSCVQRAAVEVQVTVPTYDEAKQIIGLSLDPAFARLFPAADAPTRLALCEAYKDIYLHHDKTATPLFSGAIELFTELQQQGYLLAVATGKMRRGLNRIFEETQTGHFFTTSRCADEAQSKPHPQMLEQILVELKLHSSEAIMVGDTVHDLAMAHAISMPRVGITHGVHKATDFAPFAPKAVIDSLPELVPHC
ncbi:MAG: HAD-IA family hydrolase [Gammaproteobacteria bacterium]|jgi:phosphoglycolate phosphatase|nr:HAD-IA family hydrolase [Gammaproteobacteria bacterium]MBU2278707.1 HAD-IA family hydrolase [Gammaproteobacteria bacterium]MBU2426133.1 HAD-IA family hydrolase [Gammaproteobacteria bacterium]